MRQARRSLYRELLRDARPYWPHLGALLALSLLSSVFALLTPLPLKIAVDSVVGSHPLPGFVAVFVPGAVEQSMLGVLLVAAGLFVLVAVLKQLQELGNLVLGAYTGENLLLRFRTRLFRHVERLPLGYHDTAGTADSTYRIQYDAMAVQTIIVTGLIPLFAAGATVAGMIFVTARIDAALALVSLAVAPALFVALRRYRRRLRAQWHEAKRLESSALSVVQESLDALRVVKAFGGEDHARDRFAERSAAGVRAKVKVSLVEGRFGIVVGTTIGLGMGIVLFLGTRRVQAGAMTLGELVLVMAYLQQLYDPLKTAAKKMGALQSALASAERVYGLLDSPPDFVDPPDALPLARAAGEVEFRQVSFAYDAGHPVLHDVSFSVPAGTRLGIAGTTGAGKTTLVSLLTRFYDPSDGEILLDGIDLRRYRLADLRAQFAIVLQEPVLFSTSIGENIRYARPEASHADVVAAAEAAAADGFIRRLPQGYDTPVGDRGVCLSGGERQRIALARAFLKDAPILVLDEPTSSVDTWTEADILQALERLMVGRTTLTIAHREATLAASDARLRIEHGRVAIRAPARRAPVEHPAAQAWRQVAPMRARIAHVQQLRAKRQLQVYRLTTGDGARVIAKRRPSDALLLERTIFETVLPALPQPALRCFGSAGDSDARFRWLFIEDPGGEACSLARHADLAGRWLGDVHGAAAQLGPAASLPARDAAHYLARLRSARATMLESFGNPALREGDRRVLNGLVWSCDRIHSDWAAVEALCRELPRTLIHGDLRARHLRICDAGAGPAVVACDWRTAGFGVPAVDVSELARHARDLADYRAAMARHGHDLDDEAVRALVFVGTGLRLLECLDWVVPHLRYPSPERATATLGRYETPLREWSQQLARAA